MCLELFLHLLQSLLNVICSLRCCRGRQCRRRCLVEQFHQIRFIFGGRGLHCGRGLERKSARDWLIVLEVLFMVLSEFPRRHRVSRSRSGTSDMFFGNLTLQGTDPALSSMAFVSFTLLSACA
ncbi:hypothetical protein BC939DRAFT_263691 [Gamsiella multidivaricata]|uniref:uncharacterized protein n=1 Tax=Gamsiella multidivaricata TaxID=101098 RepID=UPI00221F3F14|nr:uncharacterized protein BC939DRAFT_263691 [Gamsiella multidivaricata]KAI7819395.1 hypothetical protein BC939DRAFT_263691 [Gamsiella multidivaricata]